MARSGHNCFQRSWTWSAVIGWHTLRGLAASLATIAAMLALAFVTRYSRLAPVGPARLDVPRG